MRFPALPLSIACVSLCGAAFAGDTTYSRTESVPKTSAPSRSGSSSPASSRDEGESGHSLELDWRFEGHGFMTECMEVPGPGIVVIWPLWLGVCGAADGLRISHAHLFAGHGDMEAWPDGRWRFGWGFGLGAAFMPGQSGGLPLELQVEATGALSEGWELRLRSGAFAHLMSHSVDYRRDVFVDGKRIGGQLDVMDGYIQSGFPLFADGIRLLGSRGLYLAGGAGLVALDEDIDYVRETDYGPAAQARREDRWQALPAVDLGLGRYGGGGPRSFWRFELRYQAILHSPRRMTSFPGDNAEVTHAVTWEWAWF